MTSSFKAACLGWNKQYTHMVSIASYYETWYISSIAVPKRLTPTVNFFLLITLTANLSHALPFLKASFTSPHAPLHKQTNKTNKLLWFGIELPKVGKDWSRLPTKSPAQHTLVKNWTINMKKACWNLLSRMLSNLYIENSVKPENWKKETFYEAATLP